MPILIKFEKNIVLLIKPIKGFNSFSPVYQSGKKFYDKELTAVFITDLRYHGLVRNCNDLNTFYYGVSAGKKYIKKAVVRNRVKRLLRESIRKIFYERFHNFDNTPFLYAVFSWRKAPQHPALINLDDVYPSVENVFNSAEKYFGIVRSTN